MMNQFISKKRFLFKTSIKRKLKVEQNEFNPELKSLHSNMVPNQLLNKKCKKGRWTLKEHIEFLKGIEKYGKDFSKIKINSRSHSQIISHAQKFFEKLKNVKDEQLGINFTSDSIKNIKDMIVHIKSVNVEYDVINVLLYLSEKYDKERYELNHNINLKFQKNNEIALNEEKNDIINGDHIYINNINNLITYNLMKNILLSNIIEDFKNILYSLCYMNNSIV